ncbi:uncharacterized protein C8Q71DRAFT_853739 [Rhodofomes roseus]|uniref:BTB domain-containing protein n=1 Tax=Rhodofomes roseus TaxID=34475 RepID=A0ABQ8KRV8_9APHY|nr:uncharacterized protein C8Q71DRAFT_853739 [Rhodofomes roseus]KAH9841335.1 hypothetical protein C8Q71DRAFT_853739 [Rhodofomes roseus]
MASSSSKRHKRKASPPPVDTDKLIDDLINQQPKRPRYSKSAKPSRPKVSLNAARLETNKGLRAKGKEVAKGKAGSSGTKAKASSPPPAQVSLSANAKPYRVGRVALLPYGLDDSGDIQQATHSKDIFLTLMDYRLATSLTPDGRYILISPGMDRNDIDALLKQLFPLYFEWAASEGYDSAGSEFLWRVVGKQGRQLRVMFRDESMPIAFPALCNAVHYRTTGWTDRTWCFVSTMHIPKDVWESWAGKGKGKGVDLGYDDSSDESVHLKVEGSEEGDVAAQDEELGTKSEDDASADGSPASGNDTDVSEWQPEPLAQKKKTSRKLARAVDALDSSFSSFSLVGEATATLASGLQQGNGDGSDAAMITQGGDMVTVKLNTEMQLRMTRSTRFWNPDGTLFIGVGRILYRIYAGHLANNSPVFNNLFHVPGAGMASPRPIEGTVETCPLYLWNIENLAFEALADYLGCATLPDGESLSLFRPSVQQLIGLLKLATMWDMTRARSYAIDKLNCTPLVGDPEWGPIAKIACCLAYGIDSWLVPGLRAAVQLSPIGWDTAHFAYFKSALDANEVNVLCRRIDRHRKALAWNPPTYTAGLSCPAQAQCNAKWAATWHQALAGKLLHPDDPMSDHELLEFIDNAPTRETGLCYVCHIRTLLMMKANPEWSREEEIIQSTAERIKRNHVFYTS